MTSIHLGHPLFMFCVIPSYNNLALTDLVCRRILWRRWLSFNPSLTLNA